MVVKGRQEYLPLANTHASLVRVGRYEIKDVPMKRLKKRLITLCPAAAVLASLMALPANAEPNTRTSEEIARSVYTATDPVAAVASLPEAELKLFEERMENWSSVDQSGPIVARQPSAAEARMMGQGVNGGAPVSPMSGCFSQDYYKKWYDVLINTGDTWMTLNWCHDGTNVTSRSVSNVGGRGYLGITYDGTGTRLWKDYGSFRAVAQQFQFSFWVLGAQPCMLRANGVPGEVVPANPDSCTV